MSFGDNLWIQNQDPVPDVLQFTRVETLSSSTTYVDKASFYVPDLSYHRLVFRKQTTGPKKGLPHQVIRHSNFSVEYGMVVDGFLHGMSFNGTFKQTAGSVFSAQAITNLLGVGAVIITNLGTAMTSNLGAAIATEISPEYRDACYAQEI